MFHPVSNRITAPSDFPSPPSGGNAAPAKADGVEGGGKPMVQVAAGNSGCMGCVGGKNGLIPQEKLEDLKAKMYDKIMAHEQAHASAAGAFGGQIHIDYDSNGIAVGGHVPIMIPGLNKMNPEESLRAFEQIYSAAMAPGDPSSQDMSVAAQAQDLMGRAKVMMDQKTLREASGGQNPNQQANRGANGNNQAVPSATAGGSSQQGGAGQGRPQQNPFALAV